MKWCQHDTLRNILQMKNKQILIIRRVCEGVILGATKTLIFLLWFQTPDKRNEFSLSKLLNFFPGGETATTTTPTTRLQHANRGRHFFNIHYYFLNCISSCRRWPHLSCAARYTQDVHLFKRFILGFEKVAVCSEGEQIWPPPQDIPSLFQEEVVKKVKDTSTTNSSTCKMLFFFLNWWTSSVWSLTHVYLCF